MPELPEVETVRRGLFPHLVGKRIADAIVRERRMRLSPNADFRRRVRGKRVLNLRRRGKYLIFDLEDGAFLAHLGMSGAFYFSSSPPDETLHEHVGLKVGRRFLTYKDPRRFGGMVFCESDPDSHPFLQKLGPEPLSENFNGAILRAHLRGKQSPLKTALMNGDAVAGIGNIYASESLHQAGVLPQTPSRKLSAARAERVAAAIKDVLRRAIRAGGSTMRDYQKADGAPGYFQMQWKVYGRENAQCACGGKIKKILQSARATYYCPRCQR